VCEKKNKSEKMAENAEELLQPKRYAIKFNPPRFILEYTDGKKTRIRSVRYPKSPPHYTHAAWIECKIFHFSKSLV
jgi:hypothetical protein